MQNKNYLRYTLKIFFLLLLVIQGTGCAFESVKPWHRDILAKQSSQLIPDPLEYEADEHIYFSKEGAKGGQGVGGGGCGCN